MIRRCWSVVNSQKIASMRIKDGLIPSTRAVQSLKFETFLVQIDVGSKPLVGGQSKATSTCVIVYTSSALTPVQDLQRCASMGIIDP